MSNLSKTDARVKIILANDSRLLREMLRRVLKRSPRLEIVAEIEDLDQLGPVLAKTGASWIIVSLTPEGKFPGVVKTLLHDHTTTHVLAIATDASAVKLLHMEPNERQVDVYSVEEILSLFSSETS
jgi:DNA-binding NarL/FixJ family response regulator